MLLWVDLPHNSRFYGSRCRFGRLRGLPLKGSAMRMHNPPHPGEIIKSLCLEPLKVTVTDAAKALRRQPQDSFGDPKWSCGRKP